MSENSTVQRARGRAARGRPAGQRRADARAVRGAAAPDGRGGPARRSPSSRPTAPERACELREVASGWRLQVRPQHAEIVSRLWQERPSRYSRALLETLALIAYRQPITRGEIEDIRGVTVSTTIMRTLHERNWMRVVGHREVPGRPELLGTTREFLDYFGLKSLDDLPTLAELRDLDDIKRAAGVSGRRAGAGRGGRAAGADRHGDDRSTTRRPRRRGRRASRRPMPDERRRWSPRPRRQPGTLIAILDERLHKLLAQHGIGSRRQVEDWIREGRVLVNGTPGRGRPARPRRAIAIVVDGRDVTKRLAGDAGTARHPLPQAERRDAARPRGRRSRGVEARLPSLRSGRWLPVNALGFGEEGLLVLTSDGTLAAAIARNAGSRCRSSTACACCGRASTDDVAEMPPRSTSRASRSRSRRSSAWRARARTSGSSVAADASAAARRACARCSTASGSR